MNIPDAAKSLQGLLTSLSAIYVCILGAGAFFDKLLSKERKAFIIGIIRSNSTRDSIAALAASICDKEDRSSVKNVLVSLGDAAFIFGVLTVATIFLYAYYSIRVPVLGKLIYNVLLKPEFLLIFAIGFVEFGLILCVVAALNSMRARYFIRRIKNYNYIQLACIMLSEIFVSLGLFVGSFLLFFYFYKFTKILPVYSLESAIGSLALAWEEMRPGLVKAAANHNVQAQNYLGLFTEAPHLFFELFLLLTVMPFVSLSSNLFYAISWPSLEFLLLVIASKLLATLQRTLDFVGFGASVLAIDDMPITFCMLIIGTAVLISGAVVLSLWGHVCACAPVHGFVAALTFVAQQLTSLMPKTPPH